MFRLISFSLLICFAALSAFAQMEKYTVPVKWERYKVSDKKVSVLLPKLPSLIENWNPCSEVKTKEYAVYTDQTVYGFTIASKSKDTAPFVCPQKQKFDEKSFQARLNTVKQQLKEFTETTFDQNNLTINKVAGTDTVYWIINDFSNQRWFEFWIVGEGDEKTAVRNFVKSIEIGANPQGIEIGSGTTRTYGDESVKVDESKKTGTSPLKIVFKPQPKYTDAARQMNVQGSVMLKVTFYAHGGIASVTPITTLRFGLTEEAVSAAWRTVFIPAKRDGVSYHVSKTIYYTFSIY
jgi:Gram-negative bacterial TonB protein C-terminal